MTTKTLLMEKVERDHGATLEQIIEDLTRQGKSRDEMARYLGISYWTFSDWLRELGATFETTTTVRFPQSFSAAGVD